MRQAIFHPAARRELAEAIDHYNAERQGLGREFREEVQRVLALLIRFPRLGQPVRGSVRRMMLSRFPYHIYELKLTDFLGVTWRIGFDRSGMGGHAGSIARESRSLA